MNKKLNCILLVDDNEPTNFLHEMIINESDCSEQIVSVESAREGLDYVESAIKGAKEFPELIFLDINMPGMTGWEFLAEFEKINFIKVKKPIIIMLTTSLNPDDKDRALQVKSVDDYRTKPLNKNMLKELLEKYFKQTDTPVIPY